MAHILTVRGNALKLSLMIGFWWLQQLTLESPVSIDAPTSPRAPYTSLYSLTCRYRQKTQRECKDRYHWYHYEHANQHATHIRRRKQLNPFSGWFYPLILKIAFLRVPWHLKYLLIRSMNRHHQKYFKCMIPKHHDPLPRPGLMVPIQSPE